MAAPQGGFLSPLSLRREDGAVPRQADCQVVQAEAAFDPAQVEAVLVRSSFEHEDGRELAEAMGSVPIKTTIKKK